ncbi:hypothetical protein AcW1_000816 [Taiwanofungus camphoratus]|nr:hypothetical protein AcW2_000681 [Antrodia cinnamomea]KAI0961843.1 hypothetical protein AcV7_000836 [Antrodia cinnamomea]KAI0963853.1 hypothetical protein AcW1_000816 [Antrodia cinnamomea]
MSVMNSPADLQTPEDHLRHLLDQRTARADLHGRFPSLSEFSDSPSVYSRAHFSPRPLDRAELDANTNSFHFVIPPQTRAPSSEPRSPMSDRERLNFPNASSLDLDDDPRSSYEHNNSPEDDQVSVNEEDEELLRISMYGPKMRFHSRAPWELGEDDVFKQDEKEASSSKRSKGNKGDSGKKVWGRNKGNNEKRPSTDSNRSQGKAKQSFESYSNGGALLALAQASMSSTSLALTPSPQTTLRDKLSLPRLRSRTPSHPHPNFSGVSSPESVETRLPPQPSRSGNTSPMSRLMGTASPTQLSPLEPTFSNNSSSRSPTPVTPEYTHPYANPDLVRRVYEGPKPIISSPKSVISTALPAVPPAVTRSDSNATLTDTATTSSMFQSRSTTTISLTPGTSLSSVNPSPSDSSPPTRVASRGISTPIPVSKPAMQPFPASILDGTGTGSSGQKEGSSPSRNRETKLLSSNAFGGFPGWNETPGAPSIKLISLEEAQARERSRSATNNPVISSSYASSLYKSRVQGLDLDQRSITSEKRTRSTSAGGVKAKMEAKMELSQCVPTTPTESSQQSMGSGALPRGVSRKKSGFMRLFNNAKDRDKPLNCPLPPVPSLSTDTVAHAPHPVPSTARVRKASAHRVPVPSLSPSLLGVGDSGMNNADSGSSSDSASHYSDSKESVVPRERQLSARRNAPDLSIMTSPSVVSGSSKVHPASAANDTPSHGYTVSITPTPSTSLSSTLSAPSPSSAPPGATDFVALSLRPVSTLFSTTFSDNLISPQELTRPSLDVDHGTPTTATTAISPLSPDFPLKSYSRVSEDKGVPMIAQDDQSPVIQALQEQIMSARKAWQRQIWELEGQVRDLKAEVEELRTAESAGNYCSACGRGSVGRPSVADLEDLKKAGVKVGVVNRPRARTGVGSRFASGT